MENNNKMMSSSDLIDAKLEEHQFCASKQCPGCGHKFEANTEWVGLPAGVKFDPTDQELIQHLEAKVESKHINMNKCHPLIDEFIPTIEGEDGICYTHPEKLPGVRRDGLSRHFFHRPSKAYTTGTRKRRKIQNYECSSDNDQMGSGETRWHKTGKTRGVVVNGEQKGCKKILVLYTNFGKNRKPEKTNWVMHQYHLGEHEEEKEGELVVSKIFYQTHPRQCTTSCSSKQILTNADHESNVVGLPPPSTYAASFDSDNFTFIPFTKTFHQVGVGDGSRGREVVEGSCEQVVNDDDHEIATTGFHISRPSHPISTIIAHQSPSIILDDVSRFMLHNDHFQQQQQQHHKLGGRSASGLEELIMGCTSTNTKQESTITTTPQEAEWFKYSSYWPDPDNPGHHHG